MTSYTSTATPSDDRRFPRHDQTPDQHRPRRNGQTLPVTALEAPYRIRRRQAATPEARDALTNTLSDLQARIARHRSWLRVEAPPVAEAYDTLIAAARSEAGVQMTEAWNSAPPASDADMNLRVAYQHPNSDAERDKVIAVMRQNLRYLPSIRSLGHKRNAVTGSTSIASQP